MRALRLALLADGSSDRALLPILHWTLREQMPEARYFGPEFVARNMSLPIDSEIRRVAKLAKPDLLFVHRDAEREPLENRRAEIPDLGLPLVRVVPVRMTEAWLLIDEQAIRAAAGNPNGSIDLELPSIRKLESLPQPKDVIRSLLLSASELPPRRRERFQAGLGRRVILVAEHIGTFAPLRQLPAFNVFESELRTRLSGLELERRPS